jgi:hypothetical protein
MSTPCRRSKNSAMPGVRSRNARRGQFVLVVIFILLARQLTSWARLNGTSMGHLASASVVVEHLASLPAGTILPVRLEDTISVKDAQRGQAIEAKVSQDVPLPNRQKIAAKTSLKGSIVSVEKDREDSGTKITLIFSQLATGKETLTVVTYLRAIASSRAVHSAQIPLTGADGGTPTGWGDTVQIGGDIRYGDGGAVRNRAKQKVGKGVTGGVLVQVKANPALGCDGPVRGDDRPQALWVFSSDACGVYDLKGTKITRTGKAEPVGEFTLQFEKDDMKLEGGTGMLLRVVSQP